MHYGRSSDMASSIVQCYRCNNFRPKFNVCHQSRVIVNLIVKNSINFSILNIQRRQSYEGIIVCSFCQVMKQCYLFDVKSFNKKWSHNSENILDRKTGGYIVIVTRRLGVVGSCSVWRFFWEDFEDFKDFENMTFVKIFDGHPSMD